MRASFFRPAPHHRLAWLLWLALLMPLSQSMATWHGYSHAPSRAAEHGDDAHAAHGTHCDLCLSAAALGAGALLSAVPGLLPLAGTALVPQARPRSPRLASPAPAYRSRAPPLR
jgi:hypothetical protein